MAGLDGDPWATEADSDVRPYAITGGRTRPRHNLRLVTLLLAGVASPPRGLMPEAERTFTLCCSEPRSVAEIAGTLRQPVQVAKVLVSDLIEIGALTIAASDTSPDPDMQLLWKLRDALHRKWPDAA
ncbi:DUF742 domain-containing protein [Streptomyces sp. NBC_00846]|nr:DUF742 domain-containing protein [Streptomyces sp. NBC_00846]